MHPTIMIFFTDPWVFCGEVQLIDDEKIIIKNPALVVILPSGAANIRLLGSESMTIQPDKVVAKMEASEEIVKAYSEPMSRKGSTQVDDVREKLAMATAEDLKRLEQKIRPLKKKI